MVSFLLTLVIRICRFQSRSVRGEEGKSTCSRPLLSPTLSLYILRFLPSSSPLSITRVCQGFPNVILNIEFFPSFLVAHDFLWNVSLQSINLPFLFRYQLLCTSSVGSRRNTTCLTSHFPRWTLGSTRVAFSTFPACFTESEYDRYFMFPCNVRTCPTLVCSFNSSYTLRLRPVIYLLPFPFHIYLP